MVAPVEPCRKGVESVPCAGAIHASIWIGTLAIDYLQSDANETKIPKPYVPGCAPQRTRHLNISVSYQTINGDKHLRDTVQRTGHSLEVPSVSADPLNIFWIGEQCHRPKILCAVIARSSAGTPASPVKTKKLSSSIANTSALELFCGRVASMSGSTRPSSSQRSRIRVTAFWSSSRSRSGSKRCADFSGLSNWATSPL